MATIGQYVVGLDKDDVVHVQAFFKPTNDIEDTCFKWDVGFALCEDKTGHLIWGLWDGRRLVAVAKDTQHAIRILNGLLLHKYYFADTYFHNVWVNDDTVCLVVPPVYTEKVNVKPDSEKILRMQLNGLILRGGKDDFETNKVS